jgi:hypothetical protein
MPKEFFDHPNNVVINGLKAKGWRNSPALMRRAGFVDVIPITTAIPYGKTSTARGIPDDTESWDLSSMRHVSNSRNNMSAKG